MKSSKKAPVSKTNIPVVNNVPTVISKAPLPSKKKIVQQKIEVQPKISKNQAPIQQVQQVPNLPNSLFGISLVPNSNNIQQQNVPNIPPQINNQVQRPVQQVQARRSNVRGGMFGGAPTVAQIPPMPYVFNDDEAIIEKVKQQQKDVKIQIQIKAQRSMAKLKEEVMLPAMCSLKTSGGSRSSVDLICVIDVSGSMNGQKIELVKSTMKYVLEALTPSDRISIITFQSVGQRVCGLKCVTQENLPAFNTYINDYLYARGGTNINAGLNLAVKTIKQRKFDNKVTSVFLLSDGQDKGAENAFKQTLKNYCEGLAVFSLHSFGFGTDHDQDLMTKLCKLKDGSFYFIKELATLDEAFCNALGGVISLVATNVVIKLSNIAKNLVQGIKIKKVYGDMWNKLNNNEYQVKILQLMSGISKDYVFQIQIPKINTQVGDLDRDHDILEAIFTAKGVNHQNITGQCCFKITLLNQNEQIPEINQNIDVIENHLRVVASQAIEQNMKKAENNQFEEAQSGIDKMINVIQLSKKARPEKMQSLVADLQNIKQKCSKQDYQVEGKKWMKSAQMAHFQQKNYAYSNCVQQEMVAMQKSKKPKY